MSTTITKFDSKTRPRAFVLSSVDHRPHLADEILKLRQVIEQHVDIVGEDTDFSHAIQATETDFVIVLGGDGSILRAAKRLGSNQIPVLGVNLGKLGFLADIRPEALGAALQAIAQNKYKYIDHLMLNLQVFRGDKKVSENVGLNEVAILGGPPFAIQMIDLYVDGQLATSYNCLRKDLQAFVISPISPHTLSVRPVIDSADRIYEFVVTRPNESTSVVLDGQTITKLESTDRIRVVRDKSVFQLIEVTDNNYYSTLREKLGWNGEFKK